LIEELGLLVRHKFSHQEIRLVCELQNDLPATMGDATQLEQAFLNLMLNAAEAMPDGGTLTIRSYAVPETKPDTGPAGVAVEFEDTGPGMTEEQRARAFNSLLTTTKEKGTGLGLAIVGRIVEAHRGAARIFPGTNGGTRIVLNLPTP
jgi:signal transduction histidine kinase